jgi:chromate transporter
MDHNPYMRPFPLRLLTGIFFRIGNTTFGGGDPTISALQRELVDRRRAITPQEYGVLYALARITPGTNMLAFCAGAGWILSGWAGALIAVTAVTLPSAIVAVLLLTGFELLARNAVAASAIIAMISAAVGLMFAASFLLIRPHLRRSILLRTGFLALASFVLVWKQLVSPIQVLALAAIVGFFWPEPFER